MQEEKYIGFPVCRNTQHCVSTTASLNYIITDRGLCPECGDNLIREMVTLLTAALRARKLKGAD